MEQKLIFKDYSEALKDNKLLGLKCNQCGMITVPPKIACGNCASTDMDIVQLSGKGSIQTFTTVYITAEGRESEAPYIIVMVELEEGPWLMGNLAGIKPESATMEIIGKKVVMKEGVVFMGDKYTAGEMARPLFGIV